MKTEILAASDEVITAVLNGVGQGIILTILVYLVLRFIGRTNAATRYCAWAATLLLVIAVIPAQYWRHRLGPSAPVKGDIRQADPPMQPATSAATGVPTPDLPNENEPAFVDQNTPSLQNALPDSDPVPQDCISALSLTGTESETSTAIEVAKNATEFQIMTVDPNPGAERQVDPVAISEPNNFRRAWSLERILNPVSWNLTSLTGIPRIASFVLLAAWLGFAAFRGGRLFGRLYQIGKIKRTALLAGPELTGLFARLRAELAVRRKVELRLCPVNASPVALGFFEPMILLPEEHSSAPEAAEAEHILRHELAHVRRYDDWANLAQNFIQAALFFHPAVWWISRRLALEREIACDDYVLQRGAGPRAYALLLADLAGRLKRRDLVFAQGVSSSKSQLQQRINMILNTRRNTSPGVAKARLGFVTASASLIALLALYSAPRVVLAQPPSPAAPVIPTPPAADNAIISATPASAPIAIVASADEPDATPAPPAAPDVGPGPKFKPGEPGAKALLGAPSVNAVPLPPGAVAVEIAGDPRPRAFPHPPGVPDAPSADSSLEERIERLEQMVKSLMDEQNPKRHGALVLRGRSGAEAHVDQKEMEKLNEKMNEMAKKHAEKAQEQAKRSAEMAERANKDFNFNFKWKAEAEQWEKGKGGIEKQLEALRKAREGLERQMENLDRQIERVERDQERMQEEKERRSELQDGEPKEETSVAEADEN